MNAPDFYNRIPRLTTALGQLAIFSGSLCARSRPFSEADQPSLDAAIAYAAALRSLKMYRGEKFAMINPEIPEALPLGHMLRRRDVVLFEDISDSTTSIDIPFSPQTISERLAARNYVLCQTVVNFPRNHLCELL